MLKTQTLASYPPYDREDVQSELRNALRSFDKKVIVLDDDPTGIQTVHDVYVYTDWSYETILSGFLAKEPLFFLLTNSRGMSAAETEIVHREIAENIARASRETGIPFAVISRSDSTLRGHYPLETKILRVELEKRAGIRFDGEIIMPFFPEGGRYTINDVQYVASGEQLIPAGETEFAKDKIFGYRNSNLRQWIIEKHGGAIDPEDICSIPLELLRRRDVQAIKRILSAMTRFQKCIVNAVDYGDVEVFVTALTACIGEGKQYLFRTAAALPKVMGGVSDIPLLTRKELVRHETNTGGLIIAGSHVKKTTEQLEALRQDASIRFIELNQFLVLDEEAFDREKRRVVSEAEEALRAGITVAVYTRRERFDLNSGKPEDELTLSLRISDAVTDVVRKLSVKPRYIVAKGGITSSEIGAKALAVKRARVLGQILPGVPVWETGPESKYPGISYVVFPGNVGDRGALYEAVMKLEGKGMCDR